MKVKDLDFKFSLLDRLSSDVFNITIFTLFIIIAGRIDAFRSFYFNGNSLFTIASAFSLFLMGFYGRKTYALGAFFGTLIFQILNGLSPVSSMAIGLGAGIEALIGFQLIKMFSENFKQKLEFLTRPTSILVISITAPLTKIFLLTITIYQFKNIHNEAFSEIFITNYLKDILSYLILYPVITSKEFKFKNLFHFIFALVVIAIFQFDSTEHFFYLLIFASLIPAIYKDINAANVINLGLIIGSQFLIKYDHGPFYLSSVLQTKVSYLLIFISFSLTILFIEGLIESEHFDKIRKKIFMLWTLTAVAFIFSYNYELDVEKENLNSEAEFLRITLEKKQNLYENNLRSLYGVMNANTNLDELMWKSYSNQLKIQSVYPEIDALGLIIGENNVDFKNVLVYPEEKNLLMYTYLKTENLDLLFSRFSLSETPVLSNNLSVTRDYSLESSSLLVLPIIKDFKVNAWAFNLINHNNLFSSISKDIKNYDFDVFDGTSSNKNTLFKEVKRKNSNYLMYSSVSFSNHIFNIGWYKSTKFITSRLNITPLLCIILVIFNILLISYFLTILIQKINAENLSDNLKKIVVDSEKRYKAIFSASSDGIVIFKNHQLIECNIKFYELFEIRTNLESLSFYDLFSTVQENFVESNEIVDQKIADTQKFDQAQFEAICKRTSSVFNAEVKLNRLYFKNAEYFIASFIDITERKFTEKNLIKSKEFALEAAKAKSRFLSNMSHEIRTPLNGILGLVNIMLDQKSKLDHDQLKNLKVIEFSANHLVSILNEILDYSKIENGSIVINKRIVNLKELINNISSLHLENAKAKSINIFVNFDSTLPEFILIDELRTGQILNNLLSNAIKFTPAGEVSLHVTLLEQRENQVTILFAVKDSGIGIPSDKINYIFNEFTQADEDHSRKYGGTGLGLSISKKLIELQGGSIQVDSIVNQGTTMSYSLQLEVPQTNSTLLQENQSKKITEENFTNKKVLLVEDNEVNILVAKKYLDKWGLEVFVAKDGFEAIAAAKNYPVDLILMDFHMPNMDGIEATKNIREFNKEIPIIGLSADVTSDLRQSFESYMMNDFVAKPFKSKELYSILAKFLKA